MAQTKETVILHACDAPTCTTERVGQADTPPKGFFAGTIRAIDGEYLPWEACKPVHIRKATAEVLNQYTPATEDESAEVVADEG